MRMLPGERSRHTTMLPTGKCRVQIQSYTLCAVADGDTEPEATRAAERQYEKFRADTFVIPGQSPQARIQELVADAIRCHQAGLTAGGVVPGNLTPWGQLTRGEREVWLVKAEYYITSHDKPVATAGVRGR